MSLGAGLSKDRFSIEKNKYMSNYVRLLMPRIPQMVEYADTAAKENERPNDVPESNEIQWLLSPRAMNFTSSQNLIEDQNVNAYKMKTQEKFDFLLRSEPSDELDSLLKPKKNHILPTDLRFKTSFTLPTNLKSKFCYGITYDNSFHKNFSDKNEAAVVSNEKLLINGRLDPLKMMNSKNYGLISLTKSKKIKSKEKIILKKSLLMETKSNSKDGGTKMNRNSRSMKQKNREKIDTVCKAKYSYFPKDNNNNNNSNNSNNNDHFKINNKWDKKDLSASKNSKNRLYEKKVSHSKGPFSKEDNGKSRILQEIKSRSTAKSNNAPRNTNKPLSISKISKNSKEVNNRHILSKSSKKLSKTSNNLNPSKVTKIQKTFVKSNEKFHPHSNQNCVNFLSNMPIRSQTTNAFHTKVSKFMPEISKILKTQTTANIMRNSNQFGKSAKVSLNDFTQSSKSRPSLSNPFRSAKSLNERTTSANQPNSEKKLKCSSLFGKNVFRLKKIPSARNFIVPKIYLTRSDGTHCLRDYCYRAQVTNDYPSNQQIVDNKSCVYAKTSKMVAKKAISKKDSPIILNSTKMLNVRRKSSR